MKNDPVKDIEDEPNQKAGGLGLNLGGVKKSTGLNLPIGGT